MTKMEQVSKLWELEDQLHKLISEVLKLSLSILPIRPALKTKPLKSTSIPHSSLPIGKRKQI